MRHRHLPFAIVLAAVAASAVVTTCERSSSAAIDRDRSSGALSNDEPDPAPTDRPATAAESHARMEKRLAQIERAVRVDNPFFGEREVADALARLADLPEDATRLRWRTEYVVAWNLTRLGRFEEAIEHWRVAYALAPEVRADLIAGRERCPRPSLILEPTPGMETAFDFALTWLRLAERGNCIEHHNSESCILPISGEGVHVDKEAASEAAKLFREVLDEYPNDLLTRWLYNVAMMALGEYPGGVPVKYQVPPKAFQSDVSFPRFADVAPRLGLANPDLSGGAVIDDFDDDGDLDLVTSTIDPAESLHIHRREADGSFRDVTIEAGVSKIFGGLNLIHGDYDNDGDLDLLVLRGGWWENAGRHPNSLLRNEGGLRFVDVTYLAGLAEPAWPTQTAAFADIDHDGDLDLYIGNEQGGFPAPSQLFENRGDGTFVDIAGHAGVTNDRYAKGVVFFDYDDDRYPDLYVSNNRGENRLYRNRGDRTFEDVAPRLGLTGPSLSFPVLAFDFDNDGRRDILCAEFWNHPSWIVPYWMNSASEAETSALYRNLGDGKFEEIGKEAGIVRPVMAMGANFGDLDNDGFLDVYFGTGYPGYDGLVPNVMLRNSEGERFEDVSIAGGFSHLQKGHGVAFADLDADGDQDVFEQLGGAFPGDGFGDVLFENPGFGNHRVEVRLVGVKSNRFGVGARIRAEIVDEGEPRCVFRWVDTGGSFGGNPHRQHLGIGMATKIDRLEIHWPTSDTTQTFTDVPADVRLTITEFAADYVAAPIVPLPFPM